MSLDDPSTAGDFKFYTNSEAASRWGPGVVALVATSNQDYGERDRAHTKSLLRSPQFVVVFGTPCTVTLVAQGGGNHGQTLSDPSGTWLGMLWRDPSAAQGTYIGGVEKTNCQFGAGTWETLSATISAPGSYTMDVVDFVWGGCGWIGIREVTFGSGCQ